MERIGFAFFVDIEYENIPEYCSFCSCIGHSVHSCKRKGIAQSREVDLTKNKPDMDKGKKKVIDKAQNKEKEPVNGVNDKDAGTSHASLTGNEGVPCPGPVDDVVL